MKKRVFTLEELLEFHWSTTRLLSDWFTCSTTESILTLRACNTVETNHCKCFLSKSFDGYKLLPAVVAQVCFYCIFCSYTSILSWINNNMWVSALLNVKYEVILHPFSKLKKLYGKHAKSCHEVNIYVAVRTPHQ